MTRLILVQHAEKEPAPGDPGLTARGRAQAAEVAAKLGSVGAIYASPLRRASETAAVIAALLSLDVRLDGRLRERINWDGGPLDEFLADWERTTADRDFVPAGGDSSHHAATRFLDAVHGIAAHHRHDRVAVVTHGGVTVDALRTLVGDEAVADRFPGVLTEGVPPCARTVLAVSDDGRRITPLRIEV